MRAFYVLLAALLFVSRTESVSAVSHEQLSKLVSPEQAISRVGGRDNASRSRFLRGEVTKTTDEDSDEERTLNRLVSKLAALDDTTFKAASTKLEGFFASGKADDIIDMKKLEAALTSGKVSAFLKAKNLDEFLDVKKLDDMVDPTKLTRVKEWDANDSGGLARYLTNSLFKDLKSRGIDPEIMAMAMRQHGGFTSDKIEGYKKFYNFFRTRVVSE
ncbi:uncharacterized protein KRP23_14139 [Phytophthora ramorum]|uniref:uncharacterized protein n=1 Tax=Phytophthora ramorum TaxID=164328 RepID=UPI00309A0532|nr:hypothetical protein KRP23_14139 [Phytophthora ramorum]